MLCFAVFSWYHGTAGQDVEMADALRSSGKIYVVIGTICNYFYRAGHLSVQYGQPPEKIEKEN
jgi:hypothetical protein